jgi:hypothetical protein
MGFQLKFGLPFVLLGQPLIFMTIATKDDAPWLAALGVYFFGSVLVQFHYMEIAYRTSFTVIFKRMLLCLFIAVIVAPVYAIIATGSVDQLFEPRPKSARTAQL